jgi:ABC-type transport system substrate-binding protein
LVLASCAQPPFVTPPAPISTPLPVEAVQAVPKSLVSSIDVVDPLTLRFTLNRPDAAFPQKLAFPAFGPQNPANLEQYAGGGDLMRNPVGTGPFRFEEWVQGDRITLRRNDAYWGELPALDFITYRVIKDPTARLLELKSGTVDGIDNLSPDDLAAAQADPTFQVFARPPLNIGYLGINRGREPFDDVRVRQAIAMAIDKETLVAALYPPAAQVATQFVPPEIFGR